MSAGRPDLRQQDSEQAKHERRNGEDERRQRDEAAAQERLRRPLPALTTDEVTLRYATQARTAAMNGDCGVVGALVAKIKERDAAYHAALLESRALEGCR